MIKSQELRIDNLVSYTFGGVAEAIAISGIEKDAIRIRENVTVLAEIVDGIPLTEEWLMRLGFTNEIEEELPEGGEFLCFFKDNIDIELEPALMGGYDVVGITLYEDAVDEDGQLVSEGKFEIKADIKYVHQLQNLYYALTQTELELKK